MNIFYFVNFEIKYDFIWKFSLGYCFWLCVCLIVICKFKRRVVIILLVILYVVINIMLIDIFLVVCVLVFRGMYYKECELSLVK